MLVQDKNVSVARLSDSNQICACLGGLGRFYYWQNDGNIGDYIIAEATRQMFRRARLDWLPYNPNNPPQEKGYSLVYSGGGRFVPYWEGVELRKNHLTHPNVYRCVILPHSIQGVDDFVKALDERHTVFCRERKTLDYCTILNKKAHFALAHDVGISLNLGLLQSVELLKHPDKSEGDEAANLFNLLKGSAASYARYRIRRATVSSSVSGKKIAFFLREDGEKGTEVASPWSYDLSGVWSGSCMEHSCSGPLLSFMAELVSYPDIVVTDRLHVAIMAMHVGKEVYMLDNDYGKLSGVYEMSLQGRENMHLLLPGETWPEELQCAWQELNKQRILNLKEDRYEMVDGPLISVIVPVYNTAPWLRRCLDSICSQNYQNLEILCVNDGSTDNSAEILEEYALKDARIKVFTQENAGLSAARNTALEHATGEWVTGVDSDDYLEPDVYAQATRHIAHDVDMVFFGVSEVDENGAPLAYNTYFDLPAEGVYDMTHELTRNLNVCFWSKLWRRSVIEKHALRFPHGLIHEDEALYYLAAPYIRRFAVSSAMGYNYVQRQGSIMNSGKLTDSQRLNRYVPMLEYVCNEYKKRRLLATPGRVYLVNLLSKLCMGVYWNTDRSEMMTSLEPVIRRSGVYKDAYLLERLMPLRWWERLFLSRYANSRVYRFLGIPIWAVLYASDGKQIGTCCFLWEKVKKLIR